MGLRDLLTIPRKGRRARNRNKSEADPPEERQVDRAVSPAESDLEVESATLAPGLSTPVPPASPGREPDSDHVADESIQLLGHVLSKGPGGHPSTPNQSVDPSTSYEKKSSQKSTMYSATKLAIHMVKESSDVFPPLKSVAGGLSAILNHCDQTVACRQGIESLIPRVEGLAESLSKPVPDDEVREQQRRETLKRKLDVVLQDLIPLAEQGKLTRFLNGAEDVGRLSGLEEDIRDAMMDYQTSLQQDIYDKNCQLIEMADLILLNGMHHAPDAGHRSGSRQGCLKGTRKEVLQQIESWLMDEQDQHVFWLNGLAGTGKSTITQTFAEMCFADGRLGASFFCSRDFEHRSNLHAVFPTLAFQLAYQYPNFREELLHTLRANPDVGRESLCSQMEKVIIGPLKTTCIPTLIIIDALDECRDEEPASAILSILARYVDQIPNVKFFITGRPEPRIRTGFRLAALQPITEVFKLHDVERSSVDTDIKLFFSTHLTEIAKHRSHSNLTEEWPSPSDISILCKKAAGLFIYAATAVKFVASQHHQPVKRLSLLISLPQDTVHEGGSGIDPLYTQVLTQAFCEVDLDQEVYHNLRSVVGAVLLAFNPLSMESLSDLLSNFDTPSDVSIALRSLHSLFLIPDGMGDPIHAIHKSFPDFLTDPGRCKDKRFFVDPSVHHTELLFSCLNLMKKKLKKNICNLDDYTILSRVEDLSTHQKTYIGESLEYACCFWTGHLMKIPGSDQDAEEVQRAIDEFFTTCLLFWIEVLILVRNLDVGVHAINNIQQWYISAGLTCKWADDSQRFILEYFDMINNSPSHIYHSALPLSPSKSWLREQYSSELLYEVRVVRGLQAKWGTCSRTVSFGQTPQTLTCWKDLIAAGFDDISHIIILDAITGIQMSMLSGHTKGVNSLTFSSDGTFLASGSDDNTVKLWDIQTGGIVKTFYGNTSPVLSVSISPDYTTIASGALDHTIHLWDIQTMEYHCVINGHAEGVNSVTFSPTNSQLLISASGDDTIQQWNIDGHQIGSTYEGSHAAFSSDGTYLVSWGKTVATVRNFGSGVVVTKLKIPRGNLQQCCFSPSGKLVAGCTGSTLYIWDIACSDPHLVETFVEYSDSFTSLTFTSSLVSSSYDQTIKFWQFGTLLMDSDITGLGPVLPALAPIWFVSLDTDNGVAISLDSSGVARTWDILTGHRKTSFSTPIEEQLDSMDARLIGGRLTFVWSAFEGVHTWNPEEGEQIVGWAGWSFELRMSGDGSTIFLLEFSHIQAFSIQTGEKMGRVRFEGEPLPNSFFVDGSRVWIHSNDLQTHGWNFRTSGSAPIQQHSMSLDRPHLAFFSGVMEEPADLPRIKDTVTKEEVFRLYGGYSKPSATRWDGKYLVAGYSSGEVLILDCKHMTP